MKATTGPRAHAGDRSAKAAKQLPPEKTGSTSAAGLVGAGLGGRDAGGGQLGSSMVTLGGSTQAENSLASSQVAGGLGGLGAGGLRHGGRGPPANVPLLPQMKARNGQAHDDRESGFTPGVSPTSRTAHPAQTSQTFAFGNRSGRDSV